jgi:hypothetical protein
MDLMLRFFYECHAEPFAMLEGKFREASAFLYAVKADSSGVALGMTLRLVSQQVLSLEIGMQIHAGT